MENPLKSYREWFSGQYVVWADMIAAAAMDTFDALYHQMVDGGLYLEDNTAFGLVSPDGQEDTHMDDYNKGKHTIRLLRYIDQTLAKNNVGLTSLVASLLFDTTNDRKPPVMRIFEYRRERDMVRSRYFQALVDGDAEAIEAEEETLEMLDEDYEARKLMQDTWRLFTRSRFNPDTIAAFAG